MEHILHRIHQLTDGKHRSMQVLKILNIIFITILEDVTLPSRHFQEWFFTNEFSKGARLYDLINIQSKDPI